MIPTKEQVTMEIAKLKEMKPHVRHFSAFNDDNHEAIDAQIQVLEEDMDDDGIDENWPDDDQYSIRDAAQAARSWLDGESDTATLSEEWEGLVQN
jgi:hypothetical protein